MRRLEVMRRLEPSESEEIGLRGNPVAGPRGGLQRHREPNDANDANDAHHTPDATKAGASGVRC